MRAKQAGPTWPAELKEHVNNTRLAARDCLYRVELATASILISQSAERALNLAMSIKDADSADLMVRRRDETDAEIRTLLGLARDALGVGAMGGHR